jgi:hypothetical protein
MVKNEVQGSVRVEYLDDEEGSDEGGRNGGGCKADAGGRNQL